jgi:uncharacterized membrane protein YdjX (TVP38/TMEM64 family)
MQKKRIIIVIAVVLLIVGLYYGGLKDWISLEGLKQNSRYFKEMVTHHYWLSVLIFMAVFTAAMAASLPVVAPFALLSGFLFEAIPGACYGLLSAAFGSVIYVSWFRYFLSDSMQEQFKEQLQKFKENMKIYGKSYVLILHFITVVPFFMINTLVALADFSLWDVFWTTIAGSALLFLLFAYEGRQLAHIQSVSDIFTPQFIGALLLLVALACMPVIMRRFGKSLKI